MGYILFSSEESFSIDASCTWSETMEYSYDNKKWNIWIGEKIINNKIYIRGINNTKVSGTRHWIINGTNVKCQGNIENLLDYKSVINNVHPKMDRFCFAYMFAYCQALIECPQLLSTDLAKCCYWRMFDGCDSLTTTSMFPNFTVAKEAIMNQKIVNDCHSLSTININNKLYNVNVLRLW